MQGEVSTPAAPLLPTSLCMLSYHLVSQAGIVSGGQGTPQIGLRTEVPPEFRWHPGLALDVKGKGCLGQGSRFQNSALHDVPVFCVS